MSSLTDYAGVPGLPADLAPNQVAIIPDGRGGAPGYYLVVGRRDRTKMFWLSAESLAQLPVAVEAVLNPPPPKRTRKPAAVRP